LSGSVIPRIFYHIKPLVPRSAQVAVRRRIALRMLASCGDTWPIDANAGRPPENWPGWPDGKRFALVLTHDVETRKGYGKCLDLAEMEMRLGFRSSFGFVPERYPVSSALREKLSERGFEITVHGLFHDGKYYNSRRTFDKRAVRINRYLKEWEAVGFRTPSMLKNLDWLHALDIQYDASTFDTDPFEPDPKGAGTIFPFWVDCRNGGRGYVELPYTMPQDFTLFVLLGETGIGIWKRKLDWIAERGGAALLIAHPDYMRFGNGPPGDEEYPSAHYEALLEYVRRTYDGMYWNPLPRDLASFWRERVVLRSRPETREIPMSRTDGRRLEGKPDRSVRAVGVRPLKVCMLAYAFYETDNRIRRYAETLAKRGDHVDAVALRSDGDPPVEVIRGVTVYRIQRRARDERNKYSYLGRMLSFIARSGLILERLQRERAYDVIHVHNAPDFEVFAAMLPKLRGTKIILDIHDILPEFYSAKFQKDKKSLAFKSLVAVERLSAAFADHVIVSNHIWHERLLSRSVSKEKCTVIMNYPDPDIFMPDGSRRDNGKVAVVYPGTLNRHQGLDIAIRAFALLKDKTPQAEFHIYGEGAERERLERLASDLDVRDRILFQGRIPIDRLAAEVAKSDIGVVPKRDDPFGGEAFSTKILEFMMMKVPVIVSATRIDRHYFNDSVVRFFKPDDVEHLARCMHDLIVNEELRRKLAEDAFEFVRDKAWNVKKHEYLELLERIAHA
jgi:glycosyltransferase involved in cell wall biosynthesis